MFLISNPADSSWLTTQPREHEASAPGKMYLFMKRPLDEDRNEQTDPTAQNWEDKPDEILELPVGTNASNLEDENTIIVQEVVDLTQERLVATNTDVLYDYAQTPQA